MSTPPIQERIAARARRRRLPHIPVGIAWRVADVAAIAACTGLLLHALL